MEVIQVEAQLRTDLGKNATKKLRNDGLVPAVIYGNDGEAVHITLNLRELNRHYKNDFRYNAVFDIMVKGGDKEVTERVFTYVLDRHPISQDIRHVDFKRTTLDQPVKATIPVLLRGTAPGVKKGGILVQRKKEVKVYMAPEKMPAKIELDISRLNVGMQIKVSDLKESHGLNFTGFEDTIIVRVDKGRGMTADAGDDEDEEAGNESAAEGESATGNDATATEE